MCNQESKFEFGKWYRFKDQASMNEFSSMKPVYYAMVAKWINEAGAFRAASIGKGIVCQALLWDGETRDLFIHPTERKFFTEYAIDEDGVPDDEETEAPEITAFPLTKITISNNEEAWSVFQMLKAHFKE